MMRFDEDDDATVAAQQGYPMRIRPTTRVYGVCLCGAAIYTPNVETCDACDREREQEIERPR